MARVSTQAEINGFEGGLVTDKNPLQNSPNTTSAESNMSINTDSSRSRRLGFDFETSYTEIDSSVVLQPSLGQLGSSMFNWKNAGGDVDKELMVVQVGGSLKIFDLDNTPITSEVIYQEGFTGVYSNVFNYAVVDGILVVGTGLKEVVSYEYDGGTITKTVTDLLIRDLFGVESVADSVELTSPQNFQYRPATLPDEHTYNLRNNTFALPRYNAGNEVLVDPIDAFFDEAGKYPSNSDNLLEYLFADANDSGNRNIERFWPIDMRDTPSTSSQSPKGFFIIDALERGKSRLEEVQKLVDNNPSLTKTLTTLPSDRTPDGATVVTEHAGRVWYGGFSAKVLDGDIKSPRMSSYVLFSRLVRDSSDIGRCYQDSDPTSPVDNAIVDTDGGFIRIDGAYDIKAMISVSSHIIVFAKNGVWTISGGDSDGFKATDYTVRKVSSNGLDAARSVVAVDDSVMYWGEESIYLLNVDQVSTEYSSRDITTTVIKDFFLDIPLNDRKTCSGYFDKYTRKVYWVYSSGTLEGTKSSQLLFNIDFNAFTVYDVNTISGSLPQIVDLGESQPYIAGDLQSQVTSGGVDVVSGGELVVSTTTRRTSSTREVVYLAIRGSSPTITYSIGAFTDVSYTDWSSLGGVDSGAFLTSNGFTGGTSRYEKQIPYLTTFFRQTEDAIDDSYNLVNQSSCLVSSRWGWSDSQNSNKWSVPRQAYRIRRPYMGNVGPIDNGETMLVTRNKIRGSGKAIAFHFESEAGKDLHIYGWSFNLNRTDQE